MTTELKWAVSLSVGVHAALLAGLPADRRVAFDVERAPTSLEIVVVAPPKRSLPEPSPAAPEPSVAIPEEPDPAPKTLIAPERRGVLTEVLPQYLRNPAPVYPHLARERGEEGTVVLEVEVLPSGRCGALRILDSSGHAMLDEAAARAVRRWQFKPATRWGGAIAVWVEIPVTFRLLDATGSF